MFLSHASVKRPIAMTCFILMLIMFGVVAYRNLGLDFFPDVEIPYVTVTTVYPGASPEEIEVDIAKKIEDAVGTIDGLKEMNTTCMENVCQIVLEFELGRNVDVAAMDVREKIDKIRSDLPAAAESPTILKFDPNASAVITMVLVGDVPINELYDYADQTLSPRLSSISGVAEVKISGGEAIELHVEIDREKLSGFGISIAQVVDEIGRNNLKIPAGRVRDGVREFNVTYDSEYKDIPDLGSLEIGVYKDRRVYLRDVAQINMASEEKRSLAFFNGEPGVMVKIVKKGDANAVAVINRVRAEVNELESTGQLPGGVALKWVRDSGAYIEASVDDAWGSIAVGVALTALILFAFLHELRSTFIVAISMPVSIVITFWVMQLCSYTFNQFTLLALGTSVGVLVTNSIVVLENITRRLAAGDDRATAADTGTGEVAVPVFASAMTNVVVFGPVAMMSSLVGRYLVPFAVTMTIATLVSLFVSFTLTPILASKLLVKEPQRPRGMLKWFFALWDRGYSALAAAFDASIGWVERHPAWPGIIALALLAFTFVWVAPRVGMTFTPEDDRGELTVKLEFPTYYNLDTTTGTALEVSKAIREFCPDVQRTATVVGEVQGSVGQASEGVYLAEITVVLSRKTERAATLDQIRELFRSKLANIPNCIVTVNVPSSVGGSAAQMDVKIAGDKLDVINSIAGDAAASLRLGGKAKDVDTNVRPGKPEVKILPRRAVMRGLDIDSQGVGTMLRGVVDGIKSGTYKSGARSYDVRVKMKDLKGVGELRDLTFGSVDGKPLNVEVISDFASNSIPIQINRNDRQRVSKLFANAAPGVGLNDLVLSTSDILQPMIPAGYKMLFGGQVTHMREANRDFAGAILMAVVLTYLLIAAILESWTQPFLIMFTVPLAVIGMYGALFAAGIPVSIFGMLGFVMLIGIVVNNAILIMDDVAVNKAKGMTGKAVMRLAVMNKFRPILMTSVAAILGILPMALGTGLGSETRSSCGVAVAGGLLSSTILSLYVIPGLYMLFCRDGGSERGSGSAADDAGRA